MKKNYSNKTVPVKTINAGMSYMKGKLVMETKFTNVKVEKIDNRSFYEKNPHIAQEQRKIQLERNLDQIHMDTTDWGAHRQKDDFSKKVYELVNIAPKLRLNYDAITSVLNRAGPHLQNLKRISEELKRDIDNDSWNANKIRANLENEANSAIYNIYSAYFSIERVGDGIPQNIRKIFADEASKINPYCVNDGGKCSVYNYMRAEGLIPPIENEEEMKVRELTEQLNQMRLQMLQRNNVLFEKDNALAEKDNALAEKNNALVEKDNIIENQVHSLVEKDNIISEKNNALAEKDDIITQQQNEKTDLTNRLNSSEENNIVLQEKLDTSQAKVIPLEERVVDLKVKNAELKDDKIGLCQDKEKLEVDKNELREDKIELREGKKEILEANKLLLVDKKFLQDMCVAKDTKITQLEQIHCNDPTHFEMINHDVEIGGNVNNTLEDFFN